MLGWVLLVLFLNTKSIEFFFVMYLAELSERFTRMKLHPRQKRSYRLCAQLRYITLIQSFSLKTLSYIARTLLVFSPALPFPPIYPLIFSLYSLQLSDLNLIIFVPSLCLNFPFPCLFLHISHATNCIRLRYHYFSDSKQNTARKKEQHTTTTTTTGKPI